MNYSALIQNRKSVREFADKPVSATAVERIRSHYRRTQPLIRDLATELWFFDTDARAALEGAAGYHKFLVGAPRYMVLLSEQGNLAHINAGYIMEELVLKLTDMDLSSCWVTFHNSEDIKKALRLESPLEVAAIVAFGHGKKTTKRLRLNIRSMSDVDLVAQHRYMEPKRSVRDLAFVNQWGNTDEMDSYIGFFDEMLWEALYGASLAPSYLNRQAYGFLLHEGRVSLVSRPDAYNTRIDGDLSLGIVLHHFTVVAENWAGKLNWRFGTDAAELELPEGHQVIATCSL